MITYQSGSSFPTMYSTDLGFSINGQVYMPTIPIIRGSLSDRTYQADTLVSGPVSRYGNRSCHHISIDVSIPNSASIQNGQLTGDRNGFIVNGSPNRIYLSPTIQPKVRLSGRFEFWLWYKKIARDSYAFSYSYWAGNVVISFPYFFGVRKTSATSFDLAIEARPHFEKWGNISIADAEQMIESVLSSVEGSSDNIDGLMYAGKRSIFHSFIKGRTREQIAKVAYLLKYKIQKVWETDPHPSKKAWGALSVKAAETAKVIDCNLPMYIKEGFELFDSTLEWVRLLRSKNLKDIPSIYLSTKYGLRLTVADTKDMVEAIGSWARSHEWGRPYSRLRSRTTEPYNSIWPCVSDSTMQCNLTVYYRPYDTIAYRVLNALRTFDLEPSLLNAWDFVPYSFVVDWILPVGDLLNAFDQREFYARLDILEVIKTEKHSFNLSFQYDDFVADATVEVYDRSVGSILPTPTIDSDYGSSILDHIPESTALLMQRIL